MHPKTIRGAGGGGKGGGGSGSTPVEAPNSARSKSYAQVVDLICEGEIEGLANGLCSVYLDGTPVQNADGSNNFGGTNGYNPDGTYNFSAFNIQFNTGTQTQSYLTGFSDTENTTVIGTTITYAEPVEHTITDENINACTVTIGTPQMSAQDTSNGNINGTTVDFAIDVQTGGAGYVTMVSDAFSFKVVSKYSRDYRVPLSGVGPWNIRVRRLTADSTLSTLSNLITLDAVTEIIESKLNYANSVVAGLLIDAGQFDHIPVRSYDVKMLKVRVPSNYDPIARTYSGAWDGTFQVAWTDNPAWCWYDLVTNTRYGLGNYIAASQVDKWSLYTIAQYCDALVPDGFGGQEPRFTCNLYIQSQADALQVMTDMASIFRGMVYYVGGSVTAVQDAPSNPVALFSAANVIGGLFTYEGSSLKTRHTAVQVSWNDPTQNYASVIEYVELQAAIAQYGLITTSLTAFGTTSRGQAHRMGQWLLYTEWYESEVVTLKTGMDGATARPGQIINIADPNRSGTNQVAGRVSSGSSGISIYLDRPVSLIAGSIYTLSVMMIDGTVAQGTVSNGPGTTQSISLDAPLPYAPVQAAIWMLSCASLEPQTFRVLAVTESAKNEYAISAVAHNASKYAAIETGISLVQPKVSLLLNVPGAPINLTVQEELYLAGSSFKSKLIAGWTPAGDGVPVQSYSVRYRSTGGSWVDVDGVTAQYFELMGAQLGEYDIQVSAVSTAGKTSTAATGSVVVLGATAPPLQVQDFVVSRSGSVLNFAWQPNTDIDLGGYEIRQGTSWSTASSIGSTTSNTFNYTSAMGGTFLVCAVTTAGVYSTTPTEVSIENSSDMNFVKTYDDAAAGFPGTGLGAGITTGGVTLASGNWLELTQPWDNYTTPWLFQYPYSGPGQYVSGVADMGLLATANLTVVLEVVPIDGAYTWDAMLGSWSSYGAPDWTWLGKVGALSCYCEIRTSSDNVTWTSWQRYAPGQFEGRYAQARITLDTSDPMTLPELTTLQIIMDVPDRVQNFSEQVVPISGLALTFTPPFVFLDTVHVTLQNASVGDTYTVSGKSVTGCTVNIYSSTGVAKAGTADISAFGSGTSG